MLKIIIKILLLSLVCSVGESYANSYNIDETITEILKNSLKLKSLHQQKQSIYSAIDQNDLLQNSDAEIGLANLGKDEIEIGISQKIELNRKIDTRIETIRKDLEINELEVNTIKRELLAETIRKFIIQIILQKKLKSIEEIISIAKKTIDQIKNRISAGAAMEIDLIRAQIELDKLSNEKNNLIAELAIYKNALISYMNIDVENNNIFIFNLPELNELISLPDLKGVMNSYSSYDISEYDLQEEKLEAVRNEVQADILPDLNFSLGYKRNVQAESNSIILGFSTNIPLFNRNTASLVKIDHLIKSVKLEKENSKNELISEINTVYDRIIIIEKNIKTIQNIILPKTKDIYLQLEEYYQKGRISIFEVIEARRELNEINFSQIEKQLELAFEYTNLYELTGININIFKDVNIKKYENGVD